MKDDGLSRLQQRLQAIEPGPVPDENTTQIEASLADCWYAFRGSKAQNMSPGKLIGRMEKITWDPPVLRFMIERHGGTVMGSTRAERHTWTLNLDARFADCEVTGFRQVTPRAAGMNVKKIAAEIATLIIDGTPDPRIKRRSESEARIVIGSVIPDGNDFAATVSGRRKRFRAALYDLLAQNGWDELRLYTYARKKTP